MFISPECIEGSYGSKCHHQCSGHCLDSVTCNHVTGHCDGGCDKGWTGDLCDKGSTCDFSSSFKVKLLK